ncbi:hypothetical protein ICE98_00754 [Lactococcus lactis]|nr:hypothetical protein [Lactococcus lactis]
MDSNADRIFIFPLAMLPGLLSSGLNLSKLDLKFFAIFPIIGISLAFLTLTIVLFLQ